MPDLIKIFQIFSLKINTDYDYYYDLILRVLYSDDVDTKIIEHFSQNFEF